MNFGESESIFLSQGFCHWFGISLSDPVLAMFGLLGRSYVCPAIKNMSSYSGNRLGRIFIHRYYEVH